jgi:hypothetical protein
MNELTFDDPCLVFARRQEARGFLREFRPQQRFPGAPCPARFCGPSWLTVLVLETGTTSQGAEAALQWVFSRPQLGNVPYRPKVVIAAGCCGAEDERFRIGDVVLVKEIFDRQGNRWPVPWPGELPPGEWRPPLHPGRLTTQVLSPEQGRVPDPACDARTSHEVPAIAARACKQKDVPFGCVQAIAADLHTGPSPRGHSPGPGGPLRLLAAALTSPSSAGELWRLAGQERKAALQLGKALGELLTLTLPFSVE